MNIEDYIAASTGVLVHKNFEKVFNLPAEYIKEDLWENFKLLVKIANGENK